MFNYTCRIKSVENNIIIMLTHLQLAWYLATMMAVTRQGRLLAPELLHLLSWAQREGKNGEQFVCDVMSANEDHSQFVPIFTHTGVSEDTVYITIQVI